MPKQFFDSKIMNKLRKKEKVSAAWAQLSSNLSAEILAEAGFDMLVIDTEHAPVSPSSLVSMMQAIKGTDCMPMVRAPWNDAVMIKQVLDAGAYGVHIPYVSTVAEAEYAVKSCRYAPEGIRGIAGSQRAVNYSMNKKEYYEKANRDIICMIAIETAEGVDNIEEIVKVPGLDGVFIGPADLSTSMGYLADPSAGPVKEAILKIENAVLHSDKFLGTVASGTEGAIALYDRGYSLVYMMSDAVCLASSACRMVNQFNEYLDRLNK